MPALNTLIPEQQQVNNREAEWKLIFIIIDFLLIVSLSLLVLGGFHNYCFPNKRQQSAVDRAGNLIKNKYICFWLMQCTRPHTLLEG